MPSVISSTPVSQCHVLGTMLLGLILCLPGCAVGPDYEKPETQLPQHWNAADHVANDEIQQDWWQNFHDPALSGLIEKALSGNLDLQIAEARIAEARAAHAAAISSLLPIGDLGGSATREANRLAVPGNFPGINKPFNTFQTGFDASWELDLFGGHRRQLESASADLESSEASRDDVMISLIAEIARTYIDLRNNQAQLAVAEETIASDADTVRIVKQRFDVGASAKYDLTEAEAQLQQAETQPPRFRNLLAAAANNLDVLLGEQPGATQDLLLTTKPIPVSDQKLILAAPASVIANRPDIRMAERKLASATAQQGVAVAKFFPDVSLSGFVGFLSTNSGSLLASASKSWMGEASVLWPILSYGSLSANLDTANALQQEAMANYRKTMITALGDVEKAVTAYSEQEKFLDSLSRAVEKNRHAAAIARDRFKEGQTSFLEVLDAERTLYASESQLTDAKAGAAQNLVAVYKSLGGGWKARTNSDKASP